MAKRIEVQETLEELKPLHKKAPYHLPRLKMLIDFLEKDFHSKYELAQALAVNCNSIQVWKANYEQGGLEQQLKDQRWVEDLL